MGDEGLTEYERERQRRVAQNHELLNKMVLNQPSFAALQQPMAPSERKARTIRHPQENVTLIATRKSDRNKGKTPKDYRVDMKYRSLYILEEKAFKSSRGAKGRGATRDTQNLWYNSPEAGLQAVNEAIAFATTLNNPCGLKAMTPSQVAGGFWLQLPHSFASAIGFSVKTTLTLNYKDYSRPAEFLPRGKGGGAGLSGGWRGFATDQKIHPDDVVVFEKLGEKLVYVHIFRAQDYDDQPARRYDDEEDEQQQTEEAEDDQSRGAAQSSKDAATEHTAPSGNTAGTNTDKARKSKKTKPEDAAAKVDNPGQKRKLEDAAAKADNPRKKAKKTQQTDAGAHKQRTAAGPGLHLDVVSHALQGAPVRKQCHGVWLDGWVAAYHADQDWYLLQYSDGDKEHLWLADVQAVLLTGKQAVGVKVHKEFAGEMYHGKVVSFDAKNEWYSVQYEDGDKEDMTYTELLSVTWHARPQAMQ